MALNDQGLLSSFRDIYQEASLLGLAGFAGALFEAIMNPEKDWKRRAWLGFGGVMAAVFVGGIVAAMLNEITHAGPWAYLAVGFLVGRSGEVAVKRIMDKLLGAEKDSKNAANSE